MKNLLKYCVSLLLVLGAFTLTACSSNDNDGAYYSIYFTDNPVMAAPGGGTYSVNIASTHGWTAVPQASWITDCTGSGTDGGILSFSVGANDGDDFRDGTILLSIPGSDYSATFTVRQISYGDGLTITPREVIFPTEGGSMEVVIYAPGGWEMEDISTEWITAERRNNSAITVTVSPNFTGEELSGRIMLRDTEGAVAYSVPVTQQFDGTLFLGASTPMGRKFIYGCDNLVDRVLSDEQYTVSEGVKVLEIAYLGSSAGARQPYRAFFYDVEMGEGVTILATTANDDDASIKPNNSEPTLVQTVPLQLAAMQNNRPGYTVLGGVNGDFFFGDDNNLLHGIMYRGGNCLKGTFDGGAACTVFAVMDDGSAKVMTQAQYTTADHGAIREAVGGRQILLSGGMTVSTDMTMEPRTAIGVSRDGKRVTLLVVDGRRSEYSVGASYAIMSKMFLAMDVWEAINLDGGGSSTFCVRDNYAGTVTGDSFDIRNLPTDNAGERAVANGLAIVKRN